MGKSFQGSIVLGKGFIVTTEQAQALMAKDPRNKDVLFPYLNGEDLNNDPEQKPSRWVINFFDWTEEKARTYPDCFEIVERLVKPERQRWQKDKAGNDIIGTYALRKPLPQKWWIYGEKRPALYETISKVDQVMVVAQISKTLAFTFVPINQVISMMCVVLAFDDYGSFCLLQSTIHKEWVQKYASALKSDARYTPSDVFETFPFPQIKSIENEIELERIGNEYYSFRKRVMANFEFGLTKLYNLLHNPQLQPISENDYNLDSKLFEKKYGKDALLLRKHLQKTDNILCYNDLIEMICHLHILRKDMDCLVLNAYEWNDISLQHNFYEMDYLPENNRIRYTIHPNARKKILKRLLQLNHQIYAKEQLSLPKVIKSNKKSNSEMFYNDLF
jgi:hypothetical protein